jgi:hypothetical protein
MSVDRFAILRSNPHPTKPFVAKVDRALFGEFAAQRRLQRIQSRKENFTLGGRSFISF